MKRKILQSVFLLPLLAAAAQQPPAEEIMYKSRELSLAGTISANLNLIITEKSGAVRSRTISLTSKSFSDGTEKRLIKFLEPAEVRGTSLLINDLKMASDEMWIYLPALKKTRRIVSSEKGKSFMSSEFSNADMSSPTLSDFSNRHMPGSGKAGLWIIESIPLDEGKATEYGYSRKISYLSMDGYQVRKMEFYNFDNELFKIIEIKSIHPLPGGKYLVENMVANNLSNNRRSEIMFTGIEADVSVSDAVFSVQNLER